MGSLLSPFPHEYLGHWVNGAGFGGLLPSIINVIIIAASQDPQTSGIACFLFALVITCICLVMTYVMEKSEFYQFYYAKLQENVQTKSKEKMPLKTDEKNISQPQLENNDNFFSRMKRMTYETLNIYLNLGASVWHYMLITLLNFTVTLCVFPAVVGLAESYDTDSAGEQKMPIIKKKSNLKNSSLSFRSLEQILLRSSLLFRRVQHCRLCWQTIGSLDSKAWSE